MQNRKVARRKRKVGVVIEFLAYKLILRIKNKQVAPNGTEYNFR